jgi:Divergent InlB B-repeat domain
MLPAAATAPTPVQWCGGDAAPADRKPDVLGGNSVHVVYAVPSDGQEQFGAYVHRIVTDLGAIDAWWRRQDPTRTPRFDLAPFPGCTTTAGQIDVSVARLPHPGTFFAPLDTRIRNVAVDLATVFNDATKKYLVYYDGPLDPPLQVCGTAFRGPSDRGGSGAVAVVWLRGCVTDVGSGDIQAAVAAHELLHQLGVLPGGAPHQCPGDPGHPCDSAQDLMYPQLSATFESLVLDVGRDTYYGHAGAWFDAQDSRWLMRADVPPSPLTVAVRQHAPEDQVASDPVGIACPTSCGALFDTGSQVQLAAAPADGSRFLGWTGACTGRGTCTVTLDAAKTVEAQFGQNEFRLALAVTGRGRVSAPAAGLSCTRRCSTVVEGDAVVRVRAVATKGWRFVRWSGACRGRGVCSVRLNQNRAVGAVFQRSPKRG